MNVNDRNATSSSDNSTTIIRQMQFDDLPAVVEIHLTSFKSNRSTILGKGFVHAEYQWFLCNFPVLCLVCEEWGKVIGFVVGAVPSYGFLLFRSLLPQIADALLLRPWLIFQPVIFSGAVVYMRSFRRRLPSKRDSKVFGQKYNHVTLASIAVLPSHRKLGIGNQLLRKFEERALSTGVNYVSLTVEEHNLEARKAYERAGWTAKLIKDGKAHYQKRIIAPTE